MQYDFQVISSTTVECEDYQSAFHCAVESIMSILYDHPYTVEHSAPTISVSPSELAGEVVSLSEMKKLVSGAFVDSDGRMYPQFAGVRPRKNG